MKKVITLVVAILSLSTYGKDSLDEIAEVLKYVESLNKPKAIGDGGTSYGVLQIRKACVEDVNKHYNTNYTHQDMFVIGCAEEVFKLYAQMGIDRYIKRYNVYPTTEVIVRNHNGGIYRGYRIEATKDYYRKYQKWKLILKPDKT